MLGLVLQNFFGKKSLEKVLLISTLDKVIYFIGTIYHGSTKPNGLTILRDLPSQIVEGPGAVLKRRRSSTKPLFTT
jgi:hypothetical protein